MKIQRNGSQASIEGPEEWFTGNVWIEPLFDPIESGRTGGASVTFEPGARTAWHTHPLGQTLVVTAGCGWVQREGDSIEEIYPGDVIQFAPGEKHWHGAAPTTLQFKKHRTAKLSNGWNTSAMSNIKRND